MPITCILKKLSKHKVSDPGHACHLRIPYTMGGSLLGSARGQGVVIAMAPKPAKCTCQQFGSHSHNGLLRISMAHVHPSFGNLRPLINAGCLNILANVHFFKLMGRDDIFVFVLVKTV